MIDQFPNETILRTNETNHETFSKWIDYHFTICERQDLIGASHHTLDILQKE